MPGLTADAAYPSHSSMHTEIGVSGRLPHMGLLRFTGPDAASFLQGQVSNDTRRLSDGSPLLAAYSTPQGRVVALLHLLPHSSGIIALLPREILSPTVERLRKFVLRAKVQIEDLSERFWVAGQHGGGNPASGAFAVPDPARGFVEKDGVGVSRVGAHSERCWLIGAPGDLAAHGVVAETAEAQRVEQDWRLADIREGMPQVYAATREMFVGQMLNLDLIDGISFTKGCFTGQEIIARTQHLGRIKRRLFRLRLPKGTWAIGQSVHLTDGRSGRLTELADAGDHAEALAVLNLATVEEARTADAAEAGASEGAVIAAVELPLPYAVAPP